MVEFEAQVREPNKGASKERKRFPKHCVALGKKDEQETCKICPHMTLSSFVHTFQHLPETIWPIKVTFH